ncbi:MAG: peptidase S9, partial [Bacteroidales bacterium]|nr:peptidase S9 [Bacteroidales bacterium]
MRKNLIIMALVALTLASCGEKSEKGTAYTPPQDIVLNSDIMTPEALWSMNRLGEYAVSPDGKHVVYNLTYFNIAENKSKKDIYIIDIDGNNNRCLTKSFANELS